MKILTVVGARPQFIKEAAIQKALRKSSVINEVLVHTGQHYDANMSGDFFNILSMKKPNYNLNISENLHGAMTGKMLIELEQIMLIEQPDLVLLYGDTNSTVAGALAARKLKIQIAHVESGIRQKKPKHIPEEANRIITDHISDFLFCPSRIAEKNLLNENISEGVVFSGDVMYDVFLDMKPSFDYSGLTSLGLKENDFVLLTLHRDFNVDNKAVLASILLEIKRISKEIPVLYPMHPRTKKRIRDFGLEDTLKGIKVSDPLDYLKIMGLTQHCFKAITDSGGYQKETYFAGKRAAVLMPETGWVELILNKWNKLVDPDSIYDFIFSTDQIEYEEDVYGKGNAADQIINYLGEKS